MKLCRVTYFAHHEALLIDFSEILRDDIRRKYLPVLCISLTDDIEEFLTSCLSPLENTVLLIEPIDIIGLGIGEACCYRGEKLPWRSSLRDQCCGRIILCLCPILTESSDCIRSMRTDESPS
jgi:hypothetical protein